MDFEIISDITDIETIAIGNSIREIERLGKIYGKELLQLALKMALFAKPKFIGMKRMELVKNK